MLHPRLSTLRLSLPVALIAFLLLLTAAPGMGAAQEPVTLRVWDSFIGPEGETVDAVFAAFMEANPNITIEREAFAYEQLLQTANVALSSGTGPDVVYYAPGPGYAGVLADAELIAPLEDLAEEYGWNDRVAAAALDQAKVDGVLYGLPLEIDLIGMYANRTILDQEG
jgi:raffinose/stachyose/melibiose transport system substrate-binding protein